MLKKRLIPCLDIKDGRTVKGINFDSIRDAGDPIALAKLYTEQGADELVFLDITATLQGRKTMVELVRKIAKEINIPFTVGGGITSVSDALALIEAGADKISINSAAISNPQLITELADALGSQAIVLAVDSLYENQIAVVMSHGGKQTTSLKTMEWIKKAVTLGAGEILLTSIDRDGMKKGYDLDLLKQLSQEINIPIIASGGAGEMKHFEDVFNQTEVTAALAASIFHYGIIPLPELKNYLKSKEIPIR